MSQSKPGFIKTVSCHKREPITVGGKWFIVEAVSTFDGIREVMVVTKREDHKFFLKVQYFKEKQQVELFPGVLVTFLDIAKRSKVKLRIEAAKGVPIWDGYPRHQVKERKFIPVSQVTALSHLAN